jgi:lysophospholipase L1-like esterase
VNKKTFKNNLLNIISHYESSNILIYNIHYPSPLKRNIKTIKAYNEIINSLKNINNVTIIDVASIISKQDLMSDKLHLNKYGIEKLSYAIQKAAEHQFPIKY